MRAALACGKDSRALGQVSLGAMQRILWMILGLALLAPSLLLLLTR